MKILLVLSLLATVSVLAAPAPNVGSWSKVLNLPISPLSGALLPDSTIMLWSGKTPGGWTNTNGGDRTNYVIVTLDQLLKQSPAIQLQVTANPELFCPGITNLIDGSVLVNGGSGPEATIIFNMATKKWTLGPEMNIPRGYNSNAFITSDKAFTIGGSFVKSYKDPDTGKQFGLGDKDGELFTYNGNAGGAWANSVKGSGNIIGGQEDGSRNPDPQGIFRSDNHAWLFAYKSNAGDDMLFHAGPVTQMHTINLSKNTMAKAGARGASAYAMNGNAVQYSPGRIFTVGGAPYYGDTKSNVGSPASTAAYTINYSKVPAGQPAVVRSSGNMNFKRTFGHSIVMPGGKVFVVGGQDSIHIFSDEGGILTPEIYDPTTGTFTKVANMAVARNYHSLAMLNKDGTVLVAGGGAAQNGCTTPGVAPCTPNTHFNAEVYTPPYLLAGHARPAITAVNAGLKATYGPRLKLGTTMTVKATNCGSGCTYELFRLHSATHSVNNDQMRIPLQVTKRDAANGDTVQIWATDAPFIVSGYMYLFAIASNGTPSVATVMQVTRN